MEAVPYSRMCLLAMGILNSEDRLFGRKYNGHVMYFGLLLLDFIVVTNYAASLLTVPQCDQLSGFSLIWNHIFIWSSLWVTSNQMPKMNHRFRAIVACLRDVGMLRRFDAVCCCIRSAILLLNASSIIVYFALYGVEDNLVKLALCRPYDGSLAMRILTAGHVFMYLIMHSAFFGLLQMYLSLQFCSLVYARETCHLFRLFKRLDYTTPHVYNTMKQRMELYNSFKSALNRRLGFLPFALMANLFCIFCITPVFMFFKRTTVDRTFLMLLLGCMNVILFNLLHLIVHVVSSSHENMLSARELAIQIVTTLLPLDRRNYHKLKECRQSLRVYLQCECITPSTAWNCFIVDRCMVLSFFNALIPFTVMLLTTLKELETDSSKQMGNSTA